MVKLFVPCTPSTRAPGWAEPPTTSPSSSSPTVTSLSNTTPLVMRSVAIAPAPPSVNVSDDRVSDHCAAELRSLVGVASSSSDKSPSPAAVTATTTKPCSTPFARPSIR